MKYMILVYGSQQDYDSMAGKPADGRPAWSAEHFAAMGAFMESFTNDLAESGELVETRGLTAPVHARRIQLRNDVPVVTDGPYAESQEVLAGICVSARWPTCGRSPIPGPSSMAEPGGGPDGWARWLSSMTGAR